MRFKHKPYPKDGDVRYEVFFAWLPIRIGLETRWLERVSVKQIYNDNYYIPKWENISFEQQPLPDYKHTPLASSKTNNERVEYEDTGFYFKR